MDQEIAYQHALDYLYSFVDYSLTRSFRFTPEKFNLERMVALMQRLGNPQNAYPIIHVAGTKGKGSVSAFCASVLRAAGYKTGLYTSPHLQDYAERIQLDGIPISHGELAQLVDVLRPHVEAIQGLTTFELTTALGFLYFARAGANAAVIEVGLGGRLDATNVVNPHIAAITALSYDHMNVLGNTLSQIAGEKAGIIKPGIPVVSSPQKDEALQVIERTAAERNAPLTLVGRDYRFSLIEHSLDGQSLFIWTAGEQQLMTDYIESGRYTAWRPAELMIPLLGYHQVENAATAYAVLDTARKNGMVIQDEHIRQGFAQVSWPARFEVLRRNPPVVVDSAHNPDSAIKLRLALEDYFPGLPVVLLFGASEDKDVWGMFQGLLPRVKRVVATQSIHPRAMDANNIVDLVHQFGLPAKAVLPLEAALAQALEYAGKEAAVVATGSLFIAAATRDAWFKLNQPDQLQSNAGSFRKQTE